MLNQLQNLGDIPPYAAERYGHKTALIFQDKAFTFRDLENLTNRLAQSLRKLGINPGERVSIYSNNSWEWVVSYYAIAKLGGVINPINVMLKPEEVCFVVQDCGAKAIILSADKAGPTREATKGVPGLEHIISYENAGEGILFFQDLLDKGSPEPMRSSAGHGDISTIGYTSGTTGHPKGASLTHRAVLVNACMTANMHMKTSQDRVVTALPCAHVYGNVVMHGELALGGTLILLPRFSELDALQAIQKYRATMFEGVPTMYMYLLSYPDLHKFDLSSLTRCTVGGQTMSVDKMVEVEKRFGCPLLELWGMTELAGLGTTHPYYGKNKLGSIGVPLPYTEAKIVDAEDAAKTLKAGEIGELMFRGPIVMEEYWGNEEATRETIEEDGWLHTGDICYMDEDGYIFVVDRKKDMIITAGYNIYPAELERVILKLEKVAICAVGKEPDELKGELAKAFVVLKPGERATEDEILSFCREHLANYKVPRGVYFVDDVPKTSTGKIMRRKLADLVKPA
ncbi:MAG: class I adenylate-forming enzyme family protein [Syntrophobacteraceae bacterium]